MNMRKILKMMLDFKVPQIYWNFTSENVMTLDWIDGVSIRETEELKNKNLRYK